MRVVDLLLTDEVAQSHIMRAITIFRTLTLSSHLPAVTVLANSMRETSGVGAIGAVGAVGARHHTEDHPLEEWLDQASALYIRCSAEAGLGHSALTAGETPAFAALLCAASSALIARSDIVDGRGASHGLASTTESVAAGSLPATPGGRVGSEIGLGLELDAVGFIDDGKVQRLPDGDRIGYGDQYLVGMVRRVFESSWELPFNTGPCCEADTRAVGLYGRGRRWGKCGTMTCGASPATKTTLAQIRARGLATEHRPVDVLAGGSIQSPRVSAGELIPLAFGVAVSPPSVASQTTVQKACGSEDVLFDLIKRMHKRMTRRGKRSCANATFAWRIAREEYTTIVKTKKMWTDEANVNCRGERNDMVLSDHQADTFRDLMSLGVIPVQATGSRDTVRAAAMCACAAAVKASTVVEVAESDVHANAMHLATLLIELAEVYGGIDGSDGLRI